MDDVITYFLKAPVITISLFESEDNSEKESETKADGEEKEAGSRRQVCNETDGAGTDIKIDRAMYEYQDPVEINTTAENLSTEQAI